MAQDKKDKSEKIKSTECDPHNFIVVGWSIKGGIQNANNMRCSKCLARVSLEQLESQEWKEQNGL